jgi:hypothetical protein
VDADFAGTWSASTADKTSSVKSRTGYVITFASCPVLWCSKLQTEISLSTTEAEYIALSQWGPHPTPTMGVGGLPPPHPDNGGGWTPPPHPDNGGGWTPPPHPDNGGGWACHFTVTVTKYVTVLPVRTGCHRSVSFTNTS